MSWKRNWNCVLSAKLAADWGSFLVSRLEQSELQVDETIFILSQYIASH